MASEPRPHSDSTSPATKRFFSTLKPVCVELSRLALQRPKDADQCAAARRVQELLSRLNAILDGQIQYDASVLDHKIADYVFFPLSHLLRQHESFPLRLIETAITSLRLLVQHGWKARISKDLSQQLLVFLSFIIGGRPGQDRAPQPVKPDETIVEGYKGLTALVKAAGLSAQDSPLTDAAIIPSFGHAVSLIMDGLTDGNTPDIQLEALQAALAVYTTVKQDHVLATFFPGTVSSLCRLLSPPSSTRAQRRVLVSGVNVLRVVLTKVLGDLERRNLLRQPDHPVLPNTNTGETSAAEKDDGQDGKLLTTSWLRATVAQVKLALSSVLKLRKHDASDVRQAMDRFCITLLDECHLSLSNCTSMLVESAMVLREEPDNEQANLGTGVSVDPTIGFFGTSLHHLAMVYPELMNTISATVYNWTTNMPRILQSSDERVKQQAIRNLIKGKRLVAALQIESASFEECLSSTLRDSIVILMLGSKQSKILNEVELDQNLWRTSDLVQTSRQWETYRPILLPQEGQRDTREALATLIQNLGTPSQQTGLAAKMLPYIRDTGGIDQLSSFWLSFQLLKSSYIQTAEIDAFLDLTNAVPDFSSYTQEQDSAFSELYSFSVSILDAHSDTATDEVDWRLEAIALEVTAFAAQRLNTNFRPELIDVLYPTATFLGSSLPELRDHAITTLNSIAASCRYGSVSELIIDNVDYMVNSVSLRLNQFDISPESTKVLTMMIRLTGPKLLPFLDDVVAGIFAALDNYHGYPAFVEALFGILSQIVEQGVKSDSLLVEHGATRAPPNHRKQRLESSGIQDTLAMLDKRARRKRVEEEEGGDADEIPRGHPREAWKTAADELDAIESRNRRGEDQLENPSPPNNEESRPLQTPIYSLLSRIASLTQHHLTSPTATLRKQLLDLLFRVSPALALDENVFLPLINDVWPVIVSRLHDAEPFVVGAACGTLAALCEGAGDFLSSRIKTEWWDWLGRWCLRVRDEACKSRTKRGGLERGRAEGGGVAAVKASGVNIVGARRHCATGDILMPVRGRDGHGGDGIQVEASLVTRAVPPSPAPGGLSRFASAIRTWEAVASLLVAIVSFVRIEDAIFGQILDLLADDVLPRNGAARAALEAVNADATWLALYKRGFIEPAQGPAMEGVRFAPLENVAVQDVSSE